MDEEIREAHQEAFDHIILGLTLLGLLGSGITFIMLGPASLWFLRSIALLAVVLVAFVVRRMGQFVVAVYVLVVELIGLVAGAFLQNDIFTGFVPYLFIPVIVIASLILSPPATVAAALFSMGLVLMLVAMTDQFTQANLLALLPPFSLLLLTTVLTALGGRYIAKTDQRLTESRKLLRERTLELLSAMEDSQQLQSQVENLKEQLLKTKAETQRAQQLTAHRDQRLFGLVEGAIQSLKISLSKLEQAVEALAQTPQAEAQSNLLPEAWRQIDHLTSLIISLEELVNLQQPEMRLEIQPVDLAQLLSETVQVARGLARDKQLELRYKPPIGLPPIPADPSRLRQALLHLLGNAVKYTDQGMVEVQTELTGGEITVLISDTGIGMSNEELRAIFHNFSRGQSTPAKQRPGAGLGLPLSKRIIELHDGRLWATSVLGVGSTFCLALPLQASVEKTQIALPLQRPQIADIVAELKQNKPVRPVSPPVASPAPSVAVDAAPVQTRVNFSPVARFSPVYINRFGVTLLLLLLLISSLVLALALINNLMPSQAQIVQITPSASPASVTKSAAVAKVSSPTHTPPEPTATSTASPTPLPPTPTVIGARATATPVQIEASPEPLVTSTFTPSPSPSPSATATSSPTMPPTSTPTPIPSATATTTATPLPAKVTVIAAAAKPTNPPALTVVIDPAAYPALAGVGFAPVPRSKLTLTSNPAANSGLKWLPGASGYQALFSDDLASGDRDLYITSGDGSVVNLTQSSGDDLQPAVSPDGRRIAFSSGRNGNLDIYVMNADGSNLIQLTSSRGFDEWPAWSPDGRTLAFVSDRDGNTEIYTAPAGGGPEQRLTDHPADDWPAVWSPDGRRLLFASNRDGNWNLFLLELATGTLTRLTSDPGDERDPAWSPDGQTLAFAHFNGNTWDIFTIPAPVGAPAEISRSQWTQMTTSSRDERYPAWLP